MKRKTEKLFMGKNEAQARVIPLWRNPSHTQKKKETDEHVNYYLLYFIIFYAILSNVKIVFIVV